VLEGGCGLQLGSERVLRWADLRERRALAGEQYLRRALQLGRGLPQWMLHSAHERERVGVRAVAILLAGVS